MLVSLHFNRRWYFGHNSCIGAFDKRTMCVVLRDFSWNRVEIQKVFMFRLSKQNIGLHCMQQQRQHRIPAIERPNLFYCLRRNNGQHRRWASHNKAKVSIELKRSFMWSKLPSFQSKLWTFSNPSALCLSPSSSFYGSSLSVETDNSSSWHEINKLHINSTNKPTKEKTKKKICSWEIVGWDTERDRATTTMAAMQFLCRKFGYIMAFATTIFVNENLFIFRFAQVSVCVSVYGSLHRINICDSISGGEGWMLGL